MVSVSSDWAWNLLDEHDRMIDRLSKVAYGASLEFNMNATIRGGGTCRIIDAGHKVDWLQVRLQPVHINLDSGEEIPWGVFCPVIPETEYTPTLKAWRGKLLDKTHILHSWKTSTTFTVEQGENIIAAVVKILKYAGQEKIAATDSEKTASAALTWEPGVSLLRIINDLLDSVNYRAVWTDREGVFRLEPYVLPKDRPVVAELIEGENATHRGDWVLAQDLTSVPNHVVCVGQARPEGPPFIAEAINDDPESRFSTLRRGRRVSVVCENVEAADQGTLAAIAKRRLVEASTPACMVKNVHHAPLSLDLGQVVRFCSQGVDLLATVERQQVSTVPGGLMVSDLRVVSA